MAGRRNIAVAGILTAALLASGAPSVAIGAPEPGGPTGVEAATKKCKKKGVKKKRCRKKRKLIASTVTITNCPTTPVPSGTPVTIQGVLSPDRKGRSPLGAIWESSPPAPSDSAMSFFTAPGGSFSFTFTPARPGAPAPWTTGVRVDFAGDTLFADRRRSSAACSFTSLP